jgi:hypothetical protein
MQWLEWLRAKPWRKKGSRVVMGAPRSKEFVTQHLSPLFFRRTCGGQNVRNYKDIFSEKQFWGEGSDIVLGDVGLNGFRITDWFPRAPGVYWSPDARMVRKRIWSGGVYTDSELGLYFSPMSKFRFIELGGVGTIRLRPRIIDGVDCWLATALTGTVCHGGIPLAIPDVVRRESGVDWGDRVNLRGRVRYLQDAGLDDTAASVHHARPLIVFVDKLEGVATRRPQESIFITPVALFEEGCEEGYEEDYDFWQHFLNYTFVNCEAGSDAEIDAAVGWIEKYATKYAGRIITNFDEQRPVLADAPLSYQRLVAKTYDRTVIQRFTGPLLASRIDQLIYDIGDVHMGHKINVGGSAIINIDASLSNVMQTIGASAGLDSTQKSQLEALVQSLKTELEMLKASHADETKEIAEALEKAVTSATKPPHERKKSLLQLSANGLKEAAALVKDIAPNVLTTADTIAKFIVGL